MIIHNALLLLKIKIKHLRSFDGELLLLLFLKIFLAFDRRLKIDPSLLVSTFKRIFHVVMGAACPDVVERVCRRRFLTLL